MARSGTGQPTHHAQWVQGQATACLRARLDPTDEKESSACKADNAFSHVRNVSSLGYIFIYIYMNYFTYIYVHIRIYM